MDNSSKYYNVEDLIIQNNFDIAKIKNNTQKWFYSLRYEIIKMIENIEKDYQSEHKYDKNTKFEIQKWDREGGGGGEIGLLYGTVFEKMGVNVSTVYGNLNTELAKQLPSGMAKDFWASGISIVSHPKNPFIPPIHMNTRCIITTNSIWFGGGIDLNPIIKDENETILFHKKLEQICDKHNVNYYNKFSKWCDEYFFIKHRNELRGVGGIFFDYLLDEKNPEKTMEFIKDIGVLFMNIYNEIVLNKIKIKWTDADREYQLIRRGRYAEFNLIYDRGIKFGLMTGGNTDGMMMSLPPLVKWK